MGEEYESIISNPVLLSIRESSDSDDASSLHPPAKRCRLTQRSPFSRLLKGVVLQQDGHWGAQTYANHLRLWPGTFETAGAAAISCDRAAVHFVNPDTFQDLRTADGAALAMTRDGSHESKLIEFLRTTTGEASNDEAGRAGREGIVFHELFRKELTPSDVGKLNRLVIPKKHAVRHFPSIEALGRGRGSRAGGDGGDGSAEGIMLEFKDAEGRSWEFRYCYWKSSQSFVFTKGWNRFVKAKGLQEKDVVAFSRCEDEDGRRRPFCMIDVRRGSGGGSSCGDDSDEFAGALGGGGHGGKEEEAVGPDVGRGSGVKVVLGFQAEDLVGTREHGEEGAGVLKPVGDGEGKTSFMLFGVLIK